MKSFLVSALFILLYYDASAQISGHVAYNELGIEFDIPSEWVGQETEDILVLGSNTIPGLIIIQPHQYSIQELRQQAKEGIDEGNGTFFRLSGNLENINNHTIGGEFSGTLEYESAKSYIMGLANPYSKGTGVIIMAITTPDKYSSSYKNLCTQIFNSLKFKKIDHSAKIKEWKDYLNNSRLTYMDSYYSGSSTAGGISGGYESKTTIDLCAKGYFNISSSNNASVSGSGASGYTYGNKSGEGTWDIEIRGGDLILDLNYHSGEQRIYEIEYKEDKFYLEGSRYFVTSEGEHAPDCQ